MTEKKLTKDEKSNELSAVIATLTEFGASIQNTSEIITNWHLTRTNGQIEMNGNGGLVHSAIKRVHDMSGGIGSSECSSSISPSLSERSTNGVSWSDQVKFCIKTKPEKAACVEKPDTRR